MENEFASRGGGIDVLGQATEPDPLSFKRVDRVDQMTQRPAKPIDPPDNNSVTGANLIKQTVKFGPSIKSTRGGIGEDLQTARTGESVRLKLRALISC